MEASWSRVATIYVADAPDHESVECAAWAFAYNNTFLNFELSMDWAAG